MRTSPSCPPGQKYLCFDHRPSEEDWPRRRTLSRTSYQWQLNLKMPTRNSNSPQKFCWWLLRKKSKGLTIWPLKSKKKKIEWFFISELCQDLRGDRKPSVEWDPMIGFNDFNWIERNDKSNTKQSEVSKSPKSRKSDVITSEVVTNRSFLGNDQLVPNNSKGERGYIERRFSEEKKGSKDSWSEISRVYHTIYRSGVWNFLH